jgi:predicted nucleotidyltransferase
MLDGTVSADRRGRRKSPMSIIATDLPTAEIAAFCRKWQVIELALFGSALREDFRADSDIDLLATFAPDAPWSLFDFVDMRDELESILGRGVDLIEKAALEESPNWLRRRAILMSARTIYVAR